MPHIQTILSIFALYIGIVFILPHFILPNYSLIKTKHKVTSKELTNIFKKLNKIKDDEKFVKAALIYISKHYKTTENPLIFISHFPKLFWYNPNKIIKQKGFAYCHIQNLMLKTILIESGRFKPEQIQTKTTISSITTHQYMILTINNKKLHLDPWAYSQGFPYGTHESLPNYIKKLINPKIKV
jgi:hypothetical protein